VDKGLRVTKIDGRTEFIKKLTPIRRWSRCSQILSEQAMKEMAEPTFASIPTGEVKKGQEWKKDTKLEMGPIGSYDNSFKYTYDGKDG
jgi:hypothetical protein